MTQFEAWKASLTIQDVIEFVGCDCDRCPVPACKTVNVICWKVIKEWGETDAE